MGFEINKDLDQPQERGLDALTTRLLEGFATKVSRRSLLAHLGRAAMASI